MPSDSNPYAPPAAVGVLAKARSSGSLPMTVASAVVALAYIAFTVILARFPGGDRHAGFIFVLNAPALLGLAIASSRSARLATRFGATAAFLQAVIMGKMLLTPGYRTIPVLIVSCSVIVPVLAITTWAWFYSNRRSVSPNLTQSG